MLIFSGAPIIFNKRIGGDTSCERIKRCHRRQYDMCQGHLESRHACAVIPNTNQLPIDPSLRAGSELHNRVYYYTKV